MSGCTISVKKFKEFLLQENNGQELISDKSHNYWHDTADEIFLVGYKYKNNTDCPEVKLRLEDVRNGNVRYNEDNDTLEYKDANGDWHEIEISATVERLVDIGDVIPNEGIQPGYVLAWNGDWWEPAQNIGQQVQSDWYVTDDQSPAFILHKPSIPTTLNELADVDTDGVESENILVYSAITQTWKPAPKPQGGGATTLSELTDTQIGNIITNGYVLTWNNNTQKWEPQAVAGTPGEDGQDGQDGRSVEDIQVDGGGLPSTVSGATNIYNCVDQNGQVIGSFDVTNGIQGAPGINGLTPQVRINSATHQLQVSYDGTTWEDKGLVNIQEGGTTNNFAINIKPSYTDCVSLGDAYIDSEGNLMVLVDVTQGTFDNAGNIRGPQGLQGPQGPQGATGPTGPTGKGIANISYTSTSGLVDTYTITYTDNTTSTFTVTNGEDGEDGDWISVSGKTFTVHHANGTTESVSVSDGTSIANVQLSGGGIPSTTSGVTNIYDCLDQNGQVVGSFDVTNGVQGAPGADGTTFELYRVSFASGYTYTQAQDGDYYILDSQYASWEKWDTSGSTPAYTNITGAAIPTPSTTDIYEVCPTDRSAAEISKNLIYGTFGIYDSPNWLFCTIKEPSVSSTTVALSYTVKIYNNVQ